MLRIINVRRGEFKVYAETEHIGTYTPKRHIKGVIKNQCTKTHTVSWKGECNGKFVYECLEEHITNILEVWQHLKKYYLAPIVRVLRVDEGTANKVVETVLILHDIGKATRYYQEAKRPGAYRHEVVSAYYIVKVSEQLDKNHNIRPILQTIAPSAALLHHEPILLGRVYTLGEKYVTVTQVIGTLSKIFRGGTIEFIESALSYYDDLLTQVFNSKIILPRNVRIEDVIRTVKDIIIRTSLAGRTLYKLVQRSRVASLLHVLVVCDAVAAQKRPCDKSATFITKHALLGEVGLNAYRV